MIPSTSDGRTWPMSYSAAAAISTTPETPAKTREGAMAKPREAVHMMLDGVEFDRLDLDQQLVVTALADLERLGAG